MANNCISPQEFTQFLDTQLPVYDSLIIRDIRPTDGWIGHFNVGVWPAFSATSHTRDRFRQVMPDVTKKWITVDNDSCIGGDQAPCDPPENEICWGYDRITYYQEKQSWKSQLLCFDQILTVTRAQEHVEQIISDILRPATSRITSFYARKRVAQHAGQKWLASAALTPFTFSWETTGDSEIYMTTSGTPDCKLSPQMLQRRVAPLRNKGYFGRWTNDPFWGGYDSFIELVVDDETAWELDKATVDSKVSDAWRFQIWSAANEYYKYGMGGQLGNYMVRIDPFPLRFNLVSTNRFQLVLPYRNMAATVGIGSEDNPDFHNAQYQFSFIHHRMAVRFLVQRMESVNPLMPFAVRDLSGQWRFATNDLGRDCNGNPIANYRGNKGFFYADFQFATEPVYVEWEELIFHKREPAYVLCVDTCAEDPGDPTQYYTSSCEPCEGENQIFTPQEDANGDFVIAANTITCDGAVVTHGAISEATLNDLVVTLNAELSVLGVWVLSGSNVLLTEPTCDSVVITWVV
jgi:hypothetical protein